MTKRKVWDFSEHASAAEIADWLDTIDEKSPAMRWELRQRIYVLSDVKINAGRLSVFGLGWETPQTFATLIRKNLVDQVTEKLT